ncbi:MAG: EAL domain-containing protein [Pseudomonadota bacterium]|nr:EAL domain-containing protein [Pseudomonadota bacterium]MDP1904711.1 EAL domain-containing protein [Pseudomonadota bacterium]MDP2352901.1 EAL domain-containing protein [Pseudomonadota bacterium]
MARKPTSPAALRAAAEAQLADAPAPAPARSAEDLLHELQVHQIELEMQNEALRQAQVELEESRDRYVDLYDFAPVGYLTLSHAGLIEQINLTGAALLGEVRKKLLGRRFDRHIAPEDRDRWQRQFLRSVRQGDRLRCDLALQRGDGARFYAHLDCLPLSGAEPQVRISLSDISERHHAEEELRIAAIAFESQEGIMVSDAHGVIVRVNHAFTRLTGYRADEAIGQTPKLLRSGRHDKAFYDRMWQALREKGYWQGEMWNKRKNGKIYAEWLTISAVKSPEGETTHYVGTFSEITQNKEAQAEIHRLAYYDALTHLPNRRLLMDRLGQALASSSRSGSHGAVLFIDLDNFKTLNDTRGHAVGDLLLGEVAQRLQTGVREGDTISRLGDTISRLGGDEFVVVLEDLSTEAPEAAAQAKLVGEKVRATLAQPYDLEGRAFHCTASLGITLFQSHEESVEALLKQADLALYQAKDAGRNCLRFFDPAMQSTLDESSALEADLRLAVPRGQLQLHYQPQVDSMRRVIGAEALLRWRHPQRGLVAPDVFIPLAEETGLILPIGRWVLETACAQIQAWSAHAATRDLRLAVNVSARQFRQAGFVAEVEQVLSETGADPNRLKIELTESLVIDNVAETIARMQALKALGIGFSMDDFGTGFSSLSYLKRLPLDQLKIDRSFVFDLATDPNDAAIVQTIITMGHTLGLDVIAEGVESEAQLARLDQYGCAHFQGFLFSRPLPLEAFEAWLCK